MGDGQSRDWPERFYLLRIFNFIDIFLVKELNLSKEEEMEEENNNEEWLEYLRAVLNEIREEVLEGELLLKSMHGVQFLSRSKGLTKRKHPGKKIKRNRKHSEEVILLQYGIDQAAGQWRSWSGEDRTDKGKIPWDEWATEILGEDFCDQLSQKGIHPDDYLRGEVLRFLRERHGKF